MNAQHRRPDLRRRLIGAAAGLAATALVAVALPASAAAATSPVPRRIVSGWGYFNSTSSTALTGLAANADLFTDVSPFWYTARWSGSSSSIAAASYAANKASVLPAIRATGVKVLPTITDGYYVNNGTYADDIAKAMVNLDLRPDLTGTQKVNTSVFSREASALR